MGKHDWKDLYAPPQCTELLGALGPLELSVLDALCALGEANVRQIREGISREYAYTSISATLDRLARKGIVRKTRIDGRIHFYTATLKPEDLFRQRCIAIIQSWFTSSESDAIISRLVNFVGDCDVTLLEELERKIEDRRRGAT